LTVLTEQIVEISTGEPVNQGWNIFLVSSKANDQNHESLEYGLGLKK